MTGFRHLGDRVVHAGKVTTFVVGTFEAPDGTTFDRDILRHPGAVAVVPLLDDGQTVVLVRQYRPALDAPLLEIPAGCRDLEDEDAEACARRELREEVGYECDRLDLLARFVNAPGATDEQSVCFLARGLRHVGTDLQGPEEEAMDTVLLRLEDVAALIDSGELTDAKSQIGLLRTIDLLRREGATSA